MGKKHSLDHIGLGTAQFGLDYGINNLKGQTTSDEAGAIIGLAKEVGIEVLDTAQAYGTSEEVLGSLGDAINNFNIITKLHSNINENNLKQSLLESLNRLGQTSVYGCYFHDFASYEKNPNLLNILGELKEEGLVRKVGFSLYYPRELEYLMDKKIDFDIVQVPYSVFDQRFAEYFEMLRDNGFEVHVRSVFLQGLVFKVPATLRGKLKKIETKLEALRKISKKSNLDIATICLNFALSDKRIDKVVIGVDSLDNLKANIESVNYLDEVRSIYKELLELAETDEDIILPFNWSR